MENNIEKRPSLIIPGDGEDIKEIIKRIERKNPRFEQPAQITETTGTAGTPTPESEETKQIFSKKKMKKMLRGAKIRDCVDHQKLGDDY